MNLVKILLKTIQKNMSKSKKKYKNAKRKIIIPLVVICVIFVGIALGMSFFKNNLYTVMKVPDFVLTDQNEKEISNKDMLGKVYLIEFFYSTCPTICPVMNQNMKNIKKEVNNPDFGIISISIDSERDSPAVLKKHAESIGAVSPNWHFLTGDRDYIGKIADQFNIYIGDKEDEAENLNHSGMIALVDQDGNIRCRFTENHIPKLYYSGLNYADPKGLNTQLTGKYHPDVDLLMEDIKKLLQ